MFAKSLLAGIAAGALLAPASICMAALPAPCAEGMQAELAHPNGVQFESPIHGHRYLKDSDSFQLPVEEPVLKYPYGSLDRYGFTLKFIVSESGKVECALIDPAFHSTGPAMNAVRYRFLEQVVEWPLKPFQLEGKPVRAVVTLPVNEVELPQSHIPKPDGDPAQVTITQDVVPDLASFGPYHVELHGDGTAIYTSHSWDDPLGPQTYKVDAKAVQGLIGEAGKLDFWSLRDSYRSPDSVGDHLSYERLNITVAGKTKSLTDDNGEDVGMDPKIEILQNQVMDVAGVDFWQRPTIATLEQLKANDYNFRSELAGKLLLQMTQNGGVKDDALIALMELGAPQDGEDDNGQTLIEASLKTGRIVIAKRLIADGALVSDGKTDKEKVNWAFYAAIEACSVDAIDLVLGYKPELTYLVYRNGKDESVSVLRKISGNGFTLKDCTAAAKRLIALGGDVNARAADGTTLLFKTGNKDFVRFLLEHGADPNALSNDQNTPLGIAFQEDIALLMLEHGANPRLGNSSRQLRFNISNNHWARVKSWLATHAYSDVLITPPADSFVEKPAV